MFISFHWYILNGKFQLQLPARTSWKRWAYSHSHSMVLIPLDEMLPDTPTWSTHGRMIALLNILWDPCCGISSLAPRALSASRSSRSFFLFLISPGLCAVWIVTRYRQSPMTLFWFLYLSFDLLYNRDSLHIITSRTLSDLYVLVTYRLLTFMARKNDPCCCTGRIR